MITEKAKERREELVHDLVEAMKQGTAPWQQPWTGAERPFNAVTGRRYNGANLLNLALRSSVLGAGSDPRWCTFEQAKEKGWSIKKGSKGTAVEFYKFEEKPKVDEFGAPVLNEKGEQEVEKKVLVRNYIVFHASQIDGIGPYAPKVRNSAESNEKAERILAESGADIRHGGDVAGYNIEGDYIRLPQQEAFHSQADYYATALHELTHWTGHRDRLNRPLSYDMDSEKYAREELVAEISSMFVSAETGIPQTKEHFRNHAAYVDHWIGHLEQDPNALFKAIKDAQRASEEILKHERLREQTQAQEARQETPDLEKLDDRARLSALLLEAKRAEKLGAQERADELRSAAMSQGVFLTGMAQPNNSGFYNIFKLRDTMSEAGLEPEQFDPLLKQLRDAERIQLHSGDVTVHTAEENAKNFIDENGFRMGTFTVYGGKLEDFRATDERLKALLKPEQPQEQKQSNANAPERVAAQRAWPGTARISGGEPIPVAVLTEDAIRALKLINGNEKVTIGQEANGQSYKGEVLHVDPEQGLCVQKIGRESLYVHKLDKLAEVPKVGDNVKIAYTLTGTGSKNPEEKASITIQETRHKGLRR